MSPDRDVQHRTRHTAPGDRIAVREVDAEERDGAWFAIRMPISSTAEARDGEAFTRDRLVGWRDQIDNGTVPVFGDHGKNDDIAEARYSFAGKFGYYQNAEVVDRDDGVTDLVADTVVIDPDTLPESTGAYRQHLSILKAQAEAGMPITASVGWAEDTGDRDVPGDSDLLEGSIVGIPSDARADATASSEPALARAVSAAADGFDVGRFVRELTSTERNTVTVGDEEIDLTPPEAVQNAATLALAKADELDADCGTGAGDQSARQLAGDDVTADRIDDIAAYLTSHAEDVTADGPPSEWSNDEWADCGNLQFAKWGGTGTGTGLEWAQRRANEVADAQGEERPYPDRAVDHEETNMSDTDTDTEPDADSGTDTDRDDSDGMDAAEFRESMLEMQRNQTETLNTLADAIRGDDMDGDDEDDEDEDDGENSADGDGETRTVTLDGEERTVDEALTELREAASDADPAEAQTRDHVPEDEVSEGDRDADDDSDTTGGFGIAAKLD